MKFYIEEIYDIYKRYHWLKKEDAGKRNQSIKAFSFIGERLFFPEERELFKIKCVESFQRYFIEKNSDYDFFIIGLISNYGQQSERIFNYYKFWKYLNDEFDLRGFESKLELPVMIDGMSSYVGLSSVEHTSMINAFQIISNSPQEYSIIFKKKSNNHDSESLINHFADNFITDRREIDFSKMIHYLCDKNYGICKWSSYGEDEVLNCFVKELE